MNAIYEEMVWKTRCLMVCFIMCQYIPFVKEAFSTMLLNLRLGRDVVAYVSHINYLTYVEPKPVSSPSKEATPIDPC